jgi:integrase/recombinase XerD
MMTTSKSGRKVGSTGQARVLSEKEVKQILKVISVGNNAKRNTSIVILSHYLGLRAKELAALKIRDVYEDGALKKTLRLVAAYTKGNKHRDVSLENTTVINALTDSINVRIELDKSTFHIDAPLFRSQKKTNFSPNSMVRVIGDIYKNAGFSDASSHSGRRSLITKLAYKGIDINSIRQIAGHSSISTTQRYIQDNPLLMADILKSI